MESIAATAEPPEKYLTVAEVSSRFRVSVPTIYRRCADGTLPHIRIGDDGPIRIPAGRLERLYDQGVSDDGFPAGDSFTGADPRRSAADRTTYPAGSRAAGARGARRNGLRK